MGDDSFKAKGGEDLLLTNTELATPRQRRHLIRATVGVRNQQNLFPRFPTAIARLLQYNGLGSNSGMGFLCT